MSEGTAKPTGCDPWASEKVGLLAGSGRFPVVFAEKARRLGLPVVCVGIRHEAPPELAGLVRRFYWAGMAGKIHKTALFTPWRLLRFWPDWRTLRFWYRRRRPDNRDDTLLLGVI